MINFNDTWKSFMTEGSFSKKKALREITEDEVEHIRAILDDMNGENLAFNGVFEGKTRLVLDFSTIDTTSELGAFVSVFDTLKYNVDWEKGVVSAEKEVMDMSDVDVLMYAMGEGPIPKRKTRKIQMKIGKFWTKVRDLVIKKNNLIKKVKEIDGSTEDTDFRLTPRKVKETLGEEGLEQYYRLNNQLDMYVGDAPYGRAYGSGAPAWARTIKTDPNSAQKFADYWRDNAAYIKQNHNKVFEDNFVIILTRHPIDILRMSDFDEIHSCHSPPSRSGAAADANQYYKCAVAEAYGHGAVAYVVNKEDLLHQTNTSNIESAEQEIQEGEIFADRSRGEGTFHSNIGGIEPLSRLRLRQVRTYDKDDVLNSEMGHGTEIAVPEKRIYGENIPGFRKRIMKWARGIQQEQMAKADTDEKHIYLKRFIKFGGSHEDNIIQDLIGDLFQLEIVGDPIKDQKTQDELDLNLVGSLIDQWEQQCEDIADEWNNRYQACEVSYNIEEDGAGGAYIDISAGIDIKWDLDEFKSLPPHDASDAIDPLNDFGWGYLDSTNAYIRNTSKYGIDKSEKSITLTCHIIPENLPDFGGAAYAFDPSGFEDFCVEINTVDDLYDAFKQTLTTYYKMEGYIVGGALMKLGSEIENNELVSYEWDMTAEEGYEYGEYDSITASLTVWIDPDELDLEIDPTILNDVLNSREYHILVRKNIHDLATSKMDFQYVPATTRAEPTNVDNPDFKITHTMELGYNSTDEQAEMFEEITQNVDDEDEIKEIFATALKQLLDANIPSPVQEPPINESKYLVNTWKEFLKG